MKIKLLWVAAIVIAGLTLIGCEESVDNNSSGKLKIQLTDAPFPTDLVAEANVTINKIEIRKKDSIADGYPFITLKEEEMSFNLLDLTNGVTANLVDLEIDAGTYDLIRLYVAEASIMLTDSSVHNVFVPSGAQTGIKIFIDPAIEVTNGLTSELLLDFDVSRSFVVRGNMHSHSGINGFIFKPVIKASNLSTAGRLTGFVSDTNSVAIDGAQVSVLAADTVYTTSFTDESGTYAVLGLDAGIYDVEFAKDGYQMVAVDDVEIVAGNATVVDAKLTPNDE